MGLCTDTQARMIIKQGTGIPTIPASADHRNGDWIDTDIYVGEWYMDTDTGMVYRRTPNDQIVNASEPMYVEVVIDQTIIPTIGNDYATGEVLISPPAGFGVQFTSNPIVIVDDDGTPFTWTTTNYINIESGGGGALVLMSQIDDNVILSNNAYSMAQYSAYAITGDVKVYFTDVTSHIGGGGANATFTFRMFYKLIAI